METPRRRHLLPRRATPPSERSPHERRSQASIAELGGLFLQALPTLPSSRGRGYAPKTQVYYGECLRPFLAWAGDVPVAEFDGALLTAYLGEQRRCYAPQTVQTYDKVIRVFASWLIDQGFLGHQALAGTRRATAADPPIVALSDTAVGRLLDACDRHTWLGARNRAVIAVLWRTGIRANECVSLELVHYERRGREGYLRVPGTKSDDAPRPVGIPDDARVLLDEWVIGWRGNEPGALFLPDRGEHLWRTTLRHTLAKIARQAGVEDVHPHRFRHTFSVNYLRAGGDIYTLSKLLGHSNPAMSMRYLRALQQEEAAAKNIAVMRRRV